MIKQINICSYHTVALLDIGILILDLSLKCRTIPLCQFTYHALVQNWDDVNFAWQLHVGGEVFFSISELHTYLKKKVKKEMLHFFQY